MKIKGVIFDMDGILIDSESYSKVIYQKLFEKYGYKWDDSIFYMVLGTNVAKENDLIAEYFHDRDFALKFLKEYRDSVDNAIRNGEVPLKKGAYEIVGYLKENNIPFALATSSSREKLSFCFSKAPFYGNPFEHSACGNEVTHSKPDPEIFLLAAKKIGVDIENCLIVEDSFNGLRAARASGAISCMVPDLIGPDDTIMNCIDFVKEDLLEVIELIKDNK